MKTITFNLLTVILSLTLLTQCTGFKPKSEDEKAAALYLQQTSFNALPGWNTDQLNHTLLAFEKSCSLILKREPGANFSKLTYAGQNSDWQPACMALSTVNKADSASVRRYFETYFDPYKMYADDKDEGLYTGYYEASLNGSLTQHGPYQTPLYKRPDDLVMVDLGDFRDELKGQRIAGRVIDARLKPYEDRAAITNGALNNKTDVIAWVDDPVDAFFLHIQGSGVVSLDNGFDIRVGYDGQNGHPYRPIGKFLIDSGDLTKENVSMQTIRAWLDQNPEKANELKNQNPSYVFFKQLNEDGPKGGSGLVLTPGRSLAVDYTLVPYHAPIFIDFEHPLKKQARISRLMVAQDTGGAIRGPVRGDVFWGHGEKAEEVAGQMKSNGESWILLPKTVILPPEIIKK